MRRVYESCGKLEIDEFTNAKKVTVKTHLPELKKGGKYEYINYYNISTKDHYGILGVLVVNGEKNEDLTNYPDAITTSKLRVVDGNPIHLPFDLKPFGDNDFSNLTKEDEVSFICFHDDNFETNNAEKNILGYCQSLLPNLNKPIQFFKNNKGVNPENLDFEAEPMKGNGGILTINNCI